MSNETKLIERYIEQNPHKPWPSEARLRDSGVAVCAIIGQYEAEGDDVAEVAQAYRIPAEAVEAALAYYREHKCVIDARLVENRA